MAQIKRVRKTGFTMAPEAGSQRMRSVINKNLTQEQILDTARTVYSLGWNLIKLYFMLGLPSETDEDVEPPSVIWPPWWLARPGLRRAGPGQEAGGERQPWACSCPSPIRPSSGRARWTLTRRGSA